MTYQKMLLSLKGIVEGLLGHRIANVWSIYGGLNRLHWAMERIFKNGCKALNEKGEPDCWTFISGLSLLQPSLSSDLENLQRNVSNLPEEIYNDKAMLWVYKCLEEHSLADKLNCLISHSNHLESCYHEAAFLRQKEFAAATILCLKAVEQNQPALLAELDPSLWAMTGWILSKICELCLKLHLIGLAIYFNFRQEYSPLTSISNLEKHAKTKHSVWY